MLDRVGGIIGPYIGGLLVAKNKVQALILFSVAFVLAAVASWFLDIETKGKPLRDTIDDEEHDVIGVDKTPLPSGPDWSCRS
jgi:hypothetical protein